MAIADIGFCEPGDVEAFVSDGNLQWPDGDYRSTPAAVICRGVHPRLSIGQRAVRQVRGQSTCQGGHVELSLSVAGPGTPPSSAVLFAKNV
jgi:hypothetical protein